MKLKLQLFATKGTTSGSKSQSTSHTEGGQHEEGFSSTVGGSQTHTEGGSQSHTEGGSQTHSETSSESHSKGGSESASLGHSYASGIVNDKTQQKYDQYSNDYTQNQKVDDAYQRLQDTLDKKPTFQSTYENKLNELYDQIMNRDKFSYDFNADNMYQLYKDQYTTQGKEAMKDTLGQAAALTGGYNSSYGQSAAQQTYQDYLQRLNDMIPELRNQAYNEYLREGEEMLNKYGITNDAYNREYATYRDAVSDWMNDRSFNQSVYQDERNWDYNQFANERNYWNQEYWNEKNSAHTTDNQSASSNWNDTYAHSVTDSATKYWEDTMQKYWQDSITNYWSQTASSSDMSNWSNGMTNNMSMSMSMPMGYTGGGASVSGNSGSFDRNTKEDTTSPSISDNNKALNSLLEQARRENTDRFLSDVADHGFTYNGDTYQITNEELEEIIKKLVQSEGREPRSYSSFTNRR